MPTPIHHCPVHGKKDWTDTFCDECGARLGTDTTDNNCQLCRRSRVTRCGKSKFCYECGFRYGLKATWLERFLYESFGIRPAAVDNSTLDRSPEKK